MATADAELVAAYRRQPQDLDFVRAAAQLAARTARGIRSEVEVGTDEGLPATCVINCDNILSVPIADLDEVTVGRLGEVTRAQLDQALRYALDSVF